MKAMLFYRPNSAHELDAQQYVRDFARHTGKQLPLVDMNTREGTDQAALYGVMKFPAIVAIDDQGRMLQQWSDDMLPRFDEVSYYVQG